MCTERLRKKAQVIYLACRSYPTRQRDSVIRQVEVEMREHAAGELRDAADNYVTRPADRDRIRARADELDGGR